MPRNQNRAPQHPSRTIMARTVRESVASVQALPGVARTASSAAPPQQTTHAITDEDGNISTAHVAFYDIDSYDDPNTFYYREGYDAFTI